MSLQQGFRLLSACSSGQGVGIWIITESSLPPESEAALLVSSNLPTIADSESAGMRLSLSHQPKLNLGRKALMAWLLHHFVGFPMDDALWIQKPKHQRLD